MARSDAAGRDTATQKLADRLARCRAAGVAPNGDIFIVVDRLVSAMRAGDVAGDRPQACNEYGFARELEAAPAGVAFRWHGGGRTAIGA